MRGPAATRQGHPAGADDRRDARHRQAGPALSERCVSVDAVRQRGAVPRRGHARGQRPDCGHHGAGGATEREAISRRTKEALAVAKALGVKLGNPDGAEALRRAGKAGVALRAAVTANADRFAADLVPVIEDIRAQGHTSLRAVAEELTRRGMRTRRGGRWSMSNVRALNRRVMTTQPQYTASEACGRRDRAPPSNSCSRQHDPAF
jgi:hypothetical protein